MTILMILMVGMIMMTNMTTATILIISSKRVLDHDLPRILMKRYSEDDNFDDHFDDEFVISHLLQCCLMMVMIMTRIMTTATIMLIMNLESHIFSNVDKFLGLEDIHRESFHNSVHFVQLLVHLLFSGDGLNLKKKHKCAHCKWVNFPSTGKMVKMWHFFIFFGALL